MTPARTGRAHPVPGPGDLVAVALAEDLATAGDLTTDLTVPAGATATAHLVARADGVLSGSGFVAATYAALDPGVVVAAGAADGDRVRAGQVLATVTGPAGPVLTGERVALNLVGRLSGVATATRELVDLVAHTRARICDTRKTTPGLRAAEKQAVLDGGGVNHRFGLHDAVLVKDNHIALAGGVAAVLERVAAGTGHLVRVEVEVDTLDQLDELLDLEAERLAAGRHPAVHAVLLDNMGPEGVAAGVARVRAHPAPVVVEVSGGVTAATVAALAEAGPDVISCGALTHSAPALDVALDIDLAIERDGGPDVRNDVRIDARNDDRIDVASAGGPGAGQG